MLKRLSQSRNLWEGILELISEFTLRIFHLNQIVLFEWLQKYASQNHSQHFTLLRKTVS